MSYQSFKLSQIANINIGKTPSRKNPKYWDKDKKTSNVWLSIRDMSSINGLYINDSSEYISDEGAKLFKEVPKNTLIMSFKLSIGKLAITKKNLRTNEAIASFEIRNKTKVDIKYLYFYLSSINWDNFSGHDVKVKGKTLNKKKLKEIPILVPSLSEQKKIVDKLENNFSEIDELIENSKNNLIFYNDLFKKKYLKIFSEGQKNWETITLNKLSNALFAGGDVDKKNFSKFKTDKFNIPIFTNGEKNKGLYGFTNKAKVFKPSITISARGTIGYSELRTEPFYPAVRLIVITPNTDIIESNFLKHAVKILSFVNSGSSIPQLTIPKIKKYNIKYPISKIIQKKVVKMLDELSIKITELIINAENKIRKFKKLKKSILFNELNKIKT